MTNEDGIEPRGAQNQPANQVFGDAEQFASGVFDSSILGLAVLDNQLRYVAVNHALAAIHGIPIEKHQGKTVRELFGNAALAIEPALERVLTRGERISNLEVSATLPTRDAPGHFRTSLFPVKDASGVIAKIAVIVVEVTRLREFEKCLIDFMGHLPRVRDQIVCLGLPNREENDKVQSWLASIEVLETCVRQIHRLSEMLRPPAFLSTIVPYVPHQISLPYVSPMTPKANTSSRPLPDENEPIHLSKRLEEIVRLLAQGKSNKEIATVLGTSVRTVDHQRETIMLKLDLHSLTELIYYAASHGLANLPKSRTHR
jgi:DNA-binding CsgD family transcriptional regulator